MQFVSNQSMDGRAPKWRMAPTQYIVGLLFITASLFSTVAMADDVEGKITGINQDKETITLDDGKTYKLPGEFDYSAINKGMKVIILYDEADNTRFITDIQEAP